VLWHGDDSRVCPRQYSDKFRPATLRVGVSRSPSDFVQPLPRKSRGFVAFGKALL